MILLANVMAANPQMPLPSVSNVGSTAIFFTASFPQAKRKHRVFTMLSPYPHSLIIAREKSITDDTKIDHGSHG
jgi:hypothetical protein